MSQKMTWEEIERKYPDEWVLIENCIIESGQMKEGTLVFHSKEKDDVFSHPSDSDKIGLFYTGESHFRGFRSHAKRHSI